MKATSSRKSLLPLEALRCYERGPLLILNLGPVGHAVLGCEPTQDVMQEITSAHSEPVSALRATVSEVTGGKGHHGSL